MKKFLIAVMMSSLAFPVAALEKIFGYPNWSGYWDLGVAGGYTESNFLASIDGIGVDLGGDIIDNLGSPDSETYAMPALRGQFAYTLDSDKTHFIIGNDEWDFLQFERDLRISIQHDFDFWGSLRATYLTPSAFDTEVWSDPYLVGQPRSSTAQASTGGRFIWDKILGSGLELTASYRDREIDDERSGQASGLTFDERQTLSREGDIIEVDLGYLMKSKGNRHSFRPAVTYIHRDLDGAAMAQEGFGADLTYIYTRRWMRWVNNVEYAYLSADKKNPIFGKSNDASRYTLSSKVFFPKAFGWKNWMPAAGMRWGLEDSDIDFNDNMSLIISASLFRNF
jgi:hypothetical protein